jgi:hypothetical protein
MSAKNNSNSNSNAGTLYPSEQREVIKKSLMPDNMLRFVSECIAFDLPLKSLQLNTFKNEFSTNKNELWVNFLLLSNGSKVRSQAYIMNPKLSLDELVASELFAEFDPAEALDATSYLIHL